MNRVQRLVNKLNHLKELDKRFSIFGSSRHKYQLNPTLSLKELTEIEEENKIVLSEEYKMFLSQIGNGGAGCGYGLEKLKLSRINPPYIGTKELLRNCEDPTVMEPEMVELDEISGIIKLFDHGCGMETCLVVNGKNVGEIIFYDCDGWFKKMEGKGLLEMIEDWMDQSIQEMERVRVGLLNKLATAVIEDEWEDENYFIRNMVYSIMDVNPPAFATDTEKYTIELEAMRSNWLKRHNN